MKGLVSVLSLAGFWPYLCPRGYYCQPTTDMDAKMCLGDGYNLCPLAAFPLIHHMYALEKAVPWVGGCCPEHSLQTCTKVGPGCRASVTAVQEHPNQILSTQTTNIQGKICPPPQLLNTSLMEMHVLKCLINV